MSPVVDTLLPGLRMSSDAGAPAFCSVTLITGPDRAGRTRRVLVDPGHIGILPPAAGRPG